jgi:hypothetical protein
MKVIRMKIRETEEKSITLEPPIKVTGKLVVISEKNVMILPAVRKKTQLRKAPTAFEPEIIMQ